MIFEDLKHLNIPLPETVLKERMSGNFDNARTIINDILKNGDIVYGLKCRLELELNNLDIIERTYCLSQEEAIKTIQEKIPDFTVDDFEELKKTNKVDSFYINGEIKFTETVCDTLFMSYPDLWKRSPLGDTHDYSVLENLVEQLHDGDEMKAHIHIVSKMWIKEEGIRPGEKLKVHLPFPVENDQISNLKLISCSDNIEKMPAGSEAQPTIYFETQAKAGHVFQLEYQLDHSIQYVDMEKLDLDKIAHGHFPEDTKEYLGEHLPHICFTPYLKELAKDIMGDEKNPLVNARKFYDYVTTKVDYRFVRDYAAIDNLSEYGALEQRGDCGVQSLLFITLCRIAGIPAKWQSGLDAKPGDVGEHDWAMFYVPTIGWRFADLSYGGSSYIRGALKRWNFFFGNVDPYRIPINSGFQEDFIPPMQNWRIDPYDNQIGEAEYDDKSITSGQQEYCFEEKNIYLIK